MSTPFPLTSLIPRRRKSWTSKQVLSGFLFWMVGSALASDTPLADIDSAREAIDSSYFQEEESAQTYGRTITKLWDQLRTGESWSQVLSRFVPAAATYPQTFAADTHQWDSGFGRVESAGVALDDLVTEEGGSGLQKLRSLEALGWSLVESEWHHLRFESDPEPKSTVNITLHFERGAPPERRIVRGEIEVTWESSKDGDSESAPRARSVDLRGLKLWRREGAVPFTITSELRSREISVALPGRLHPLIIEDVNGDRRPDIVLGGANTLLVNKGDLQLDPTELLRFSDELASGALLADFDNDGSIDLLGASFDDGGLRLFPGLETDGTEGPFFGSGRRCFDGRFQLPETMTTGDIDNDGDLDVFIGQYRPPYQEGNMPDPFYDANDGFPSYLLRNDGKGRFTDITEEAGLSAKRFRRSYGASFVHLDGDAYLDLLVTSDFAGVDAYSGSAHGTFSDRTNQWFQEPKLFGMSHSIADFNRDGKTDVFAVGMASTTARRLESMGSGAPGENEITAQRARMGYGNRLYLAGGEPTRFLEPESAHDVAESGWSWGSTGADLNNDGLRDLYIANGHVSGESADDYCSTFWRHDIYTGKRRKDGEPWGNYFALQLRSLVNFETSWNGYEHNTAFFQTRPGHFENLAFLFGLSQEGDSRAVAAADLDRDGDMDLVVTVLEPSKETVHRLVIYENTLSDRNWIGFDLGGPGAVPPPWNARVTLTRKDGSRETAAVVTGDSFNTQQPSARHFGLAGDDSVERVEISWPDGSSATLEAPEINRWHHVKPQAP